MNETNPMPPNLPPPAPKKTRWLLYGCGALLAFLLVIVLAVVITLWWIQRPLKPVVLSAAEKATVEEKLRQAGSGNAPAGPRGSASTTAHAPNGGAKAAASPPAAGVSPGDRP